MATTFGTTSIKREISVYRKGYEKPLEVIVRIEKDGVYMKPKRSRTSSEIFVTWREIARHGGALWL